MGIESGRVQSHLTAPPLLRGQTAPGAGGGGTDAILQENGDLLLLEAGGQVNRDTGVPAQSSAGALDGTELVAIVQSGVTVKASLAQLIEYLKGI